MHYVHHDTTPCPACQRPTLVRSAHADGRDIQVVHLCAECGHSAHACATLSQPPAEPELAVYALMDPTTG